MKRVLALTLVALILAPCGALAQDTETGAAPKPAFTLIKEFPRRPVISQGNTGTCWCFATTSFLETEVERITGKPIDLSEMYTVRYAYLEKARQYVERGGKNTFDEGGLSHDVTFLGMKYGFVPLESYPGRAAHEKIHNHAELVKVLKEVVKVFAAEGRRPSKHWESAILGVVDAYLGTPPQSIEIDGRKMTPLDYTRDVLKLKLEDYIELMSYAYSPFQGKAELTVPDNWLHFAEYTNIPIDEFMATLDGAIERGFTVAVDIDVSERGFNMGKGIAELSPELEAKGAVTQDVREKMFATKETTDDHLMHIVGVAKNVEGKRYYLTKDSNGAHGPYKGHIYISEAYLRGKALGFMMHKDALPPAAH